MKSVAFLAEMDAGTGFLIAAVAVVIAAVATFLIMKLIERARLSTTTKELDILKTGAEADAKRIVADAKATAEDELIRRREKFEEETRTTRSELRTEEKRLAKREDLIDQKL